MLKFVPIAAAGAVLAASGVSYAAAESWTKDVTIIVDGTPQDVSSMAADVAGLLENEGIELGAHDRMSPAGDTPLADGQQITIAYGRPLTVTIDGKATTHWTTAATVGEALETIALRVDDAHLAASRSLDIPRDGMMVAIVTTTDVVINVDGTRADVSARGTVADALKAAGITLSGDDRVMPNLGADLADGMEITVTRVSTKTYEKSVPLPHATVTKKTNELAKGVERIAQAGVDGEEVQKWRATVEDGETVADEMVEVVRTTSAQDEIVLIGTYVAPKPTPKPAPAAPKPTQQAAPTYSGSHSSWMSAAGISPSDFGYVEKLIMRESSWNPNAVNPSSGACGLVQALPCSKLGPNWNDPVVALSWGDSYVKSRYGGWAGAWNFWLANHWY